MKGHPPGAASGPATASIGSSCIPPAHPAAGASSGQAQHGKAGSLLPPSIWLRPTRKPSSPTSPSSPSQTFRSVPPRSPPSPAATATATAAALSPATLPQIVPTPLLSAPAPPIPPSAAPPGAPPLPAVPATPPVSTIQAGPPATQSPPHTLEIPFSRPKTLVFLDTTSQIEKGHVKRFETVVDILRQAVESDSRVRQHASNIDYYLRMCGPSRLEMYPSVLVCCPPWILKKLDKLFRKGLVARQYLRTVRDRRSILSSGGILSISGQSNASASSPYPSYDLYFWASDEPLRLTTGVDIVIAQSATGSIAIYGSDLSQTTLCGASLHWATGGARISTIGCLVQVDNKPFCLTAYHGMFGDPWQLSRSAKDLDLLNSTDSSSMYDEDSDSEDFDGISYDLPSEADSRSAPQKTSTARDPVQSDSEVSLHPGESTRSAIINSIVEPSPIRSYGSDHLDWALFPLSGTTQILPNLYWDSQNSPQPRILDSVSDKEPGLDIDVYITASQGRVKKGKLDSVPALLGALTYPHHHAIMWTVVMEQGDAVAPGDSGALVVARTAGTVYAHVVGVNALGEVVVSPFHETLRQISKHFGSPNVGLPNSSRLFVELLATVGAKGDAALVLGLLTVISYEMKQHPGFESQLPFNAGSNDQERLTLQHPVLLGIGKCLKNPALVVKRRALDMLRHQHMIPTETLNEIRTIAQHSDAQLRDIAAAILKEHDVSVDAGSTASQGHSTGEGLLDEHDVSRGGSMSASLGQLPSETFTPESSKPLQDYLNDYQRMEEIRALGFQSVGPSRQPEVVAYALEAHDRAWERAARARGDSGSTHRFRHTSGAGRH